MMNVMRNVIFKTFFFFVIVISMVQSQPGCRGYDNPDGSRTYECGTRRFGDQLLFSDNQTSIWTSGIENLLKVEYINIYYTWCRIDISSNWWYFRHTVDYVLQHFQTFTRARNSMLPFEFNVTTYGFPQTNTTADPVECIPEQDVSIGETFVVYNQKYE